MKIYKLDTGSFGLIEGDQRELLPRETVLRRLQEAGCSAFSVLDVIEYLDNPKICNAITICDGNITCRAIQKVNTKGRVGPPTEFDLLEGRLG